jgi:uncharacterized iron-regulated membrane protein
MKLYKLVRHTHKWIGIILSVAFINMAVTGFLLLAKKKYEWIQPPTREDAKGDTEDFINVQHLFEIVLNQGHEDFKSCEDIDRIDFRPNKRIYKVQSKYNHSEIQVGAVTGTVLSEDQRLSDMLEDIHDGSFIGAWIHDWFMPLMAFSLFFLTISGIYLWLQPLIRKRLKQHHEKPQVIFTE